MDEQDTKAKFGSGSTVELNYPGMDPLPTATLLYIGTEGDSNSGLMTFAYVIMHEDGNTRKVSPTRLIFVI